MNLLKSGWFGPLAGSLLFCAVMFFLVQPGKVLPRQETHSNQDDMHTPKPSWEFVNPELQRLVSELKEQKMALATKEQQLVQLDARLTAERAELNTVTQAVFRMQQDFDKKVLRVREEESVNLKRLAKMYGSMSPEGAAVILKQMEDDQVVRIMVFMRDAETGPMLESFARLGDTEAKRASAITERLRNSIKPTTK